MLAYRSPQEIPFLTPGATYRAPPGRGTAQDVISKLIPGVGNRGGIRKAAPGGRTTLVVLVLTGSEEAWPDQIDEARALLVYSGDNHGRRAETGNGLATDGNALLEATFALAAAEQREECPVFLAFHRPGDAPHGWDVRFIGLCVPGTPFTRTDDWLTSQPVPGELSTISLNYKAQFTIFDTREVSMDWVVGVATGRPWAEGLRPDALAEWVEYGRYRIVV